MAGVTAGERVACRGAAGRAQSVCELLSQHATGPATEHTTDDPCQAFEYKESDEKHLEEERGKASGKAAGAIVGAGLSLRTVGSDHGGHDEQGYSDDERQDEETDSPDEKATAGR